MMFSIRLSLSRKLFPLFRSNMSTMNYLNEYKIPIPFHPDDENFLVSDRMKGVKLINPRLIDFKPFFQAVGCRNEQLTIIMIDCGRVLSTSMKDTTDMVKTSTDKLADKLSSPQNVKDKCATTSENVLNEKLPIREKLPAWQVKIAGVLQNIQDMINNRRQKKTS